MKFSFYLFVTFFCVCANAAEHHEWDNNPCRHLQVGHQLNQCVDKYHADSQQKINATFQRVLQQFDDNKYAKQHWQQAERLWWKWVEFECQPDDPNHHSSYVPSMVMACKANKMQERERYLRQIFLSN